MDKTRPLTMKQLNEKFDKSFEGVQLALTSMTKEFARQSKRLDAIEMAHTIAHVSRADEGKENAEIELPRGKTYNTSFPKPSLYANFNAWRKVSCVDDIVFWVIVSHVALYAFVHGGLAKHLGLGG